MSAKIPVTVDVARRFKTKPERVFDAWVNPDTAGKFLFATPEGQMKRVDIDARAGGSFTITERRGGEDVEHTGTYLEFDRPCRLVFEFRVPKYTAEFTRVNIDIAASGTGSELVLVHEGVWPDYSERTKAGWIKILEQLAAVLGEPV